MKKAIFLLPLMFILSLFLVNAAIDCNLTMPSTVGIGTVLNASFNTSEDGSTRNVTVAFEARSTSQTQNSTFSVIANVTNGSQKYANQTWLSTFDVQEGNDYTFRATCYLNGSGTADAAQFVTVSSSVTNVRVDYRATAAPTAITFSNPVGATQRITATIDRANANRCFIQFGGPGVERRAMTLSGSTCTFTVQANSPPDSDYQTFVIADDRTNSTSAARVDVTIRAAGSAQSALLLKKKPQQGGLFGSSGEGGQSNLTTIVVLVVLFMIWKKIYGKKGRK